jgi:hypothetical protein
MGGRPTLRVPPTAPAVIVAAARGGCGGDDGSEAGAGHTLRFTRRDDEFEINVELQAGTISVAVGNRRRWDVTAHAVPALV